MKRKTKQLLLILSGTLLACSLAFGVACGKGDPPPVNDDDPAPKPDDDPPAVQTMTEDVFASLSGKVTFEGTYTQTFNDPLYPDYSIRTMVSYGEKTIWVRDIDTATGNTQFDYVCVEKDGKLAIVYHDAQNQIAYMEFEDAFADNDNPFADLKATDFLLQSEGVYTLPDTNKAKDVVRVLTGEEQNVTSLLVTVEGNVPKTLSFTSEDNVYVEGFDILFDCSYNYNIKDIGTGAVPDHYNTPYEATAETSALTSALDAAKSATNYTVHFTHATENDDPVEFDVYVVENAAYTENGKHGFVEKTDGVYTFTFDSGKKYTLLGEKCKDGFDFHASFSGFAPALLHYEDGMYVYRADLVTPSLSSPAAVGCASAFAVGGVGYEQYATNVRILLDNGKLSNVSYDYYNTVNGESGTCSLSFEDFNETSLPAEIDLENAKTLFEAYKGVYVDTAIDGTSYKLEITSTSIFLTIGDGDRVEAENLYVMDSGNDYLIVSFTAGGADYMFTTNDCDWAGNIGITITDLNFSGEGGILELLLPEDFLTYEENVPYPTLLYGTYKGTLETEEGDVEYTIVIDATGITLTAKETYKYAVEDLLYSNLDGISIPDTATYEDEEGNTQTVETAWFIDIKSLTEEKKALTISFHNGENDISVTLTRDGEELPPAPPFEMPEKYKGVFTGTGTLEGKSASVKIEIDEGITVTIDDGDPIPVEFTYDELSRNFYFELNGTPYVLMDVSGASTNDPVDKLQLWDNNGDKKGDETSVILTRPEEKEPEPDVVIPADFLGTFTGTGSDGKEYVLKVEAEHITVTVDGGTPTVCNYEKIVDGNDLFFTYQGNSYDIYMIKIGNSASFALWQASPSSSMIIGELTRQSEGGDQPVQSEIPSRFYGTFKGSTNGGITYELKISAEGFELKINDGEFVKGTNFRKVSDQEFYFTVDGKEYNVYNYGETGEVTFVGISCGSAATLNRQS